MNPLQSIFSVIVLGYKIPSIWNNSFGRSLYFSK